MNLFSDIKEIAAAVLGALAVFAVYSLINTTILLPKARQEGRDSLIVEQAVKSQKAELERKGDDAKLQRMSDYDLCVAGTGGLPGCDVFKLQPVRQE